MSDDQFGDQTEAELERTRKVVAAAMAEQIAINDAAARVAPEEAGAAEGSEATEAPKGNASRDEWAAYAAALGHEVDDEWGRDDIRDLFAEEN